MRLCACVQGGGRDGGVSGPEGGPLTWLHGGEGARASGLVPGLRSVPHLLLFPPESSLIPHGLCVCFVSEFVSFSFFWPPLGRARGVRVSS